MNKNTLLIIFGFAGALAAFNSFSGGAISRLFTRRPGDAPAANPVSRITDNIARATLGYDNSGTIGTIAFDAVQDAQRQGSSFGDFVFGTSTESTLGTRLYDAKASVDTMLDSWFGSSKPTAPVLSRAMAELNI